jgi:RHH-type rel operon transcriptional repressor/antitoxin RelB
MPTISLRVPVEMHDRLNKLAKESGRTKTHYLLRLIDEHLTELEDIAEAEATLAAMRRKGERGIPLEEVMAEHGLRPRAVRKGGKAAPSPRSRSSKAAAQIPARKRRSGA